MSNWNSYVSPNLGLLFYKKLYKETIIVNLLSYNENDKKLEFKINDKKSEFADFYNDLYKQEIKDFNTLNHNLGSNHFTIFTTYPGLLIGSGYTHNTKATGDASIGFYFDYTTGLPVIPGSSIKGVLRSLFEVDDDGKKQFTGQKSIAAINFIINQLNEDDKENKLATFKENEIELLNNLKTEIFGSNDDGGTDVFFDATINKEETKVSKFLSSDFITPHIKEGKTYEESMLLNPVPIQFLKVLPNVAFQFNFDLKKSDVYPALTAYKKELLFKKILLTIGIGAKTNVGYGQFSLSPLNNENRQERKKVQEIEAWEGQIPNKQDKFITDVIAKVVKIQFNEIFVCFIINNIQYDNYKLTGKPNLKVGNIIKIKVNFKKDKSVNQASFDNAILN